MTKLLTQLIFFITLPLFVSPTSNAVKKPHVTKVMTLGVFHFQFPNRDVVKISDKEKIDVLEKKYQEQIDDIVSAIKQFKPDEIFVEVMPEYQKKEDSLFRLYKQGKYKLGRSEVEQLGFRLAAELNLKHVQCVNAWGKLYKSLNYIFNDSSSRAKKFTKYYFRNPDTVYLKKEPLFSDLNNPNIIRTLILNNNSEHIKESLGPYLIGHFKYEEKPYDYTGADFEAGRWFDRNLRIYRNVQRSIKKSSKRILVIYGAGHLNILNYLFECSPEFDLVSSEPYLQKVLDNYEDSTS
jgi:hypothetical protein